MHTLIYTSTDELLAWAGRAIGTTFEQGAKAIGLARDGAVVAVSVYDHFSDGDCAIHIASDGSRRWLTPAFLAHSFLYPFVQRGQRRLTSLIPSRNAASFRFCSHIGFTLEGRLRAGMPDDDLLVLGMLRHECRWIAQSFLRRVKEIPRYG